MTAWIQHVKDEMNDVAIIEVAWLWFHTDLTYIEATTIAGYDPI
jgi:hypothetical protein